jgi:hypothetical protein
MKTYSGKNKGGSKPHSLCCLLHSEHLLCDYKPILPIKSLLASLSPPFLDFLCCCLRINPYERSSAQELLDHPFICKVTESKRLGIKDMLGLGSGGG